VSGPKTWKGVVKRYSALKPEVAAYFSHFPKLVEDFPWDVSLAYLFSRVELANNMAIYCGAVRLHRANGELTRTAVQNHHMTRSGFRELFKTIHGTAIPDAIHKTLAAAEHIRDKALHGKSTTAEEHRAAICEVFDYAEKFNDFVHTTSGFRPFDDLRGFKGRAVGLDKSTTRWLLKGMGFTSI
jgi:hypothetical protein